MLILRGGSRGLPVAFGADDQGDEADEEDHADQLREGLGHHDQGGKGQMVRQGQGQREHNQGVKGRAAFDAGGT